jgi:hypothetical protein
VQTADDGYFSTATCPDLNGRDLHGNNQSNKWPPARSHLGTGTSCKPDESDKASLNRTAPRRPQRHRPSAVLLPGFIQQQQQQQLVWGVMAATLGTFR